MKKEKQIQARLFEALILDGPMSQKLYEWEVEEHVAFWRKSMLRDKDDLLLVVTEHTDDVAMLLINKQGKLFINEAGRTELRRQWNTPGVYQSNLMNFLPQMAAQLHAGALWATGVRVMPDAPAWPGNRPKLLN